jgi:putative RNA 2'-phosphotransferase
MSKHRLKELGKIIEYILLYRPDEFGLFLNDDGSLPIKELMWALHEETGWKHVRHGHLKELAHSGLQVAFTIGDTHIEPTRTPNHTQTNVVPPRLLFFAARRKGYPVIRKHGLKPGGRPYVPLATTEAMAIRIGRRRDPKPILIEVHAAQAHQEGHRFHGCGEFLYLAEPLPSSFLTGPPPQEPVEVLKTSRPKSLRIKESEEFEMPGSFHLDLSKDPDILRRERRKQQQERKRQISQERKRKRRGRSR